MSGAGRPVKGPATLPFFVGVGCVLLLAGLGMDLGFTRPRRDQVNGLGAMRAELASHIADAKSRVAESRRLAHDMGGTDLSSALASLSAQDPVAFLGNEIDRAGLTRLELRNVEVAPAGHLQRSRYSLRLRGSFVQSVQFVHALEASPRLVTIDAISIEPSEEGSGLDTQVDLSIYDSLPPENEPAVR